MTRVMVSVQYLSFWGNQETGAPLFLLDTTTVGKVCPGCYCHCSCQWLPSQTNQHCYAKTAEGVFPFSKVFIIIYLIEIEFNNCGRVAGVLLEGSAPRKKGSCVEVKDWLFGLKGKRKMIGPTVDCALWGHVWDFMAVCIDCKSLRAGLRKFCAFGQHQHQHQHQYRATKVDDDVGGHLAG